MCTRGGQRAGCLGQLMGRCRGTLDVRHGYQICSAQGWAEIAQLFFCVRETLRFLQTVLVLSGVFAGLRGS